MVKKQIKLLFVFMCMFLLTGCAKLNTTMDITTEDVKLTIVLACKEAFKDQLKLTDEQIENYATQKYVVEEYKKDGYVGYKITKSLGKLSSLKGAKKYAIIPMQKYISADKDASKQMFNSVLGVYSARFYFPDNLYTYLPDTNTEKDSEAQKEILKKIEYKFTVTLPSRALSTNATEVSEDKKTLTWDLSEGQEVKFTFTPYLTIAIVIGSIILLLFIYSIFATWIDGLRGKTRGFKSKVKANPKNSDASPLGPMLVKNKYNNNANVSFDTNVQESNTNSNRFYDNQQVNTSFPSATSNSSSQVENTLQTNDQDLFHSIQPVDADFGAKINQTNQQILSSKDTNNNINLNPSKTSNLNNMSNTSLNINTDNSTAIYNDTNMMNGYKRENQVVSFRKEETNPTFIQEYNKEQSPATELEQMGVSSDILGRNTNNDQYMDDNMDN